MPWRRLDDAPEGEGHDEGGGCGDAGEGDPRTHDGGGTDSDDEDDDGAGGERGGGEGDEFLGEVHEGVGAGEGADDEEEHPAVDLLIAEGRATRPTRRPKRMRLSGPSQLSSPRRSTGAMPRTSTRTGRPNMRRL